MELHALAWGDALRSADAPPPTAVLLHGGGANAHWWDHLAPDLARGRRVVALDFRGHGDSEHPDEVVAGSFARDLEALLEHLGAPDALLVGHSMGAHVALAHAARAGAQGRASPRGVVAVDVSRGAGTGSRRRARLALALRRSYRSFDEAVARFRFLPGADHAPEALRVAIARHSVREEPDGRFGYKFDPRWFSLPAGERPDLGAIACPVLIVRGGESQLLTEDGAASLLAEIPKARLVRVEGAGHHVLLDRPAELRNVVERFLDECDARYPAGGGSTGTP